MSKLCKKFGPFPCDPVKDGAHCDGVNPLCVEYDPQGEKTDAVNHPEHYTTGGIECIDAIRASLGLKEFDDFEPDDSQLEMGFNPYMGGYDFDC